MAILAPFEAVIYNQDVVGDMSAVICPPYDIISGDRQKQLLASNPYNLIHMELAEDIPGQDKYERAQTTLNDWLKDRILVRDPRPAVYFYSQEYSLKGEKRTRVGFLALLGLDKNKSAVFGHEHTHVEPKEDRLRLIRKVRANLSPIFVIFADKKKVIAQSLLPHIQGKRPFITVTDDEKTVHKLWRIDEPSVLEKIRGKMETENIFIADGHHRYEVACAFRDEMQQALGETSGNEGFNFVLAYFTNIDALGLTVLPIHRLVKLDSRPDIDGIIRSLDEHFSVEEVKDETRFFFLLAKAGVAEHVIGMHADSRFWLVRLRNVKVLERLMSDKPAEYRALDVAILNALVLEKIFKLDLLDKRSLTFSAQTEELLSTVKNDPAAIAFFLNPTKIDQIVNVALKGEKMPPKSTYFYPKVASGLVIHKHG
ncbi:MAG: DUF1015 domain-containing protein [Candidatus Omnitrophica bacterium]|nr:DUF1015 domain-containing protein [Candidatus Omnitrophota bacterium]